jgi:hypothetical protein
LKVRVSLRLFKGWSKLDGARYEDVFPVEEEDIKMDEQHNQLDSSSAQAVDAPQQTPQPKPSRRLILVLIVAVGAIAALFAASPVFAASPSPAPSPSSGSATHNCPNM